MEQRGKIREFKKLIKPLIEEENRALADYKSILYKHDKIIKDSYGFNININKSQWENASDIIGNMPTKQYYNRPNVMTFHNLCTDPNLQPPPTLGNLLGLGLKFCIQEKRPSENDLDEAIKRFEKDARTKYTFAGTPDNNTDYNKKIYIKSGWKPKEGSTHLEEGLEKFRNAIYTCREETLSHTSPSTNLTAFQHQLLKQMQGNPELITLETDKNLGPAIMGRREYIECVLKEHLLCGKTYTQIPKRTAINRLKAIRIRIIKIVHEFDRKGKKEKEPNNLPENEKIYFTRLFEMDENEDFRIPQFYGNPKVHKKKKPGSLHFPLRPVVAQCGSFLAYISQYLDFKLQPFTKFLPSFIKDSTEFVDILRQHAHTFKKGDKIFTADAISMYTNIDPAEGLPTIRKYLEKFKKEINPYFPIDFIMDLLTIVMKNCVFQFGNTYWVQNIGTAMGTPVACIYAILFYGYFEKTDILKKYNFNLQLYKRAIDDICGIWRENPNNPDAFQEFKHDLDTKCKLEWECEDLSQETNFLDLTIMIDKNTGKVSTKTYQKPMNLHLYIPPHSAHSPGLMKSLVYGLLKTYKHQNSKQEDFISISKLLFQRLRDRGHKQEDLELLFEEAAQQLDSLDQPSRKETALITTASTTKHKKLTKKEDRLFFHIQFHPKDISRKRIREEYTKACETDPTNFRNLHNKKTKMNMEIDRFIVAYHRPKNLRDKLCSGTLREYGNINVATVIEENKKHESKSHG